MQEVYFFGCWRDAGHFLHDRDGYRLYDHTCQEKRIPFGRHLDDLFAPPFVNQREELTALTHMHGWTVLGMWDRSIDKRPGSNAAFLAERTFTESQMWALARAQYPQIVARLKAAQRALGPV